MSDANEIFTNTSAEKSLENTTPNASYDDLIINAEDAADVHDNTILDDDF